MILLTPEEMSKADQEMPTEFYDINEPCKKHTTNPIQLRRLCSACWAELEKEAKE